MIFTTTELPGATLVELVPNQDARGFFARTYCEREFAEHGLPTRMVQTSLSFTREAGTLRGLHWQLPPHAEDKLVHCVRGAIWDAIVDIRPDSDTYCRWIGVELSEANGRMLVVPRGFAHGFVTLSPDVLVCYQVSAYHAPEAARGARHDDPAFGIAWPVPIRGMSDRDRSWPGFARADGTRPRAR
jgi:dTDP-4-dehydrorhamnose 3,5-epimerase